MDSILIEALHFFGYIVIGRFVVAPWMAKRIVNYVENSNGRVSAIVDHYKHHTGELSRGAEVICRRDRCATL